MEAADGDQDPPCTGSGQWRAKARVAKTRGKVGDIAFSDRIRGVDPSALAPEQIAIQISAVGRQSVLRQPALNGQVMQIGADRQIQLLAQESPGFLKCSATLPMDSR